MRVAESRARFDEYNYRDSLQARAIEGIGYWPVYTKAKVLKVARCSAWHCYSKFTSEYPVSCCCLHNDVHSNFHLFIFQDVSHPRKPIRKVSGTFFVVFGFCNAIWLNKRTTREKRQSLEPSVPYLPEPWPELEPGLLLKSIRKCMQQDQSIVWGRCRKLLYMLNTNKMVIDKPAFASFQYLQNCENKKNF